MSTFPRWLFETRLTSVKADTFSSMVNISRMWVSAALEASSAVSRIYLLHQVSQYVLPVSITAGSWRRSFRRNAGAWTSVGVWTLLKNSRPGFWACGDFTLNVGMKSLCGGKIYILSPDSWLLTPTSASKSCMKETELASPLISAGHQRLCSVSVVFPDQTARWLKSRCLWHSQILLRICLRSVGLSTKANRRHVRCSISSDARFI